MVFIKNPSLNMLYATLFNKEHLAKQTQWVKNSNINEKEEKEIENERK